MGSVLPDRLAILMISGAQEDALFAHLTREKFIFTVINSSGGVLQETQVCLLVGFQSERLPSLLELVRKNCRPNQQFISTQGFVHGEMAGLPMLEAEVGGARFYLMIVDRFEQI